MPKSGETTDAALVEQCLAGRREAFQALFDRYREHVFRVAYRFVANKEDALDLTQEAFTKAFASLARFRGEASFKTWLTRIAVNASLDFRRRPKPPEVELDEERVTAGGPRESVRAAANDPAQTAQNRELQAALRSAIDQLPDAQRDTFLLHAIEGMTYQEVADTLGVAIGTVMSRIFYARKHIQEKCEAYLKIS